MKRVGVRFWDRAGAEFADRAGAEFAEDAESARVRRGKAALCASSS